MTRALLACLLYRMTTGWLVAGPLALSLGSILAHHPRGDSVLYDRGGLWLLESARHLAPDLPSIGLLTGVLALFVAFGWLLPLSLLLAETAGKRGREALGSAAERLGTLTLLLGGYLFVESLILFAGLFSSRGGGVAAWVSWIFTLGLIFAVSTLHDAARVMRFHEAEGAISAVVLGARLLRRPTLWWACLWRAVLSALALAGGFVAAHLIAPTSAAAALLAPQVGVIGHIAARASWLLVLSRAARRPPDPRERSAPDEQPLPAPAAMQ